MKSSMTPGYSWLFPDNGITYEDYLKDLPSKTVIAIAIMMNNELETTLSYEEQQKRIFNAISFRFTVEQREFVLHSFSLFAKRTGNIFSQDIFRREYFLKLILKELKRNAEFDLTDISPKQEFNFFMAYLLLVDEINKENFKILEEIRRLEPTYSLDEYMNSWIPNLSKYQFNERVSPLFEIFKLSCLSKYAFEHWRVHLKEYLRQFGFTTIGNLMHFFYTGTQSALQFKKDAVITDLSYIVPQNDLSIDPFSIQAVNSQIGLEENFELNHLKTFPLFYDNIRGYMIIDKNFYFKKIYRGPLFELRKGTGLCKMQYDTYSGEVSEKVLEKICFQAIIKVLVKSGFTVLFFDNTKSDGMPDCYIRKGNVAFLIEFKAYIFPEEHLANIEENNCITRFEKFKSYLNERFISSKGSPKGISQLINQILFLKETPNCSIDNDFFDLLSRGKISLYPIICHNDFNFSMPGINDYLNKKFSEMANQLQQENLEVMDMTLIGIDCLFDLVLRHGDLDKFQSFLERYLQTISRDKTNRSNSASIRSFDEFYFTNYIHDLPDLAITEQPLDSLLFEAGIAQDILNTVV